MPNQPNSPILPKISAHGKAITKLRDDFQRNFRERFPHARVISHRVCVITNKGPNGESDFSGKPNYWIKFQRRNIAADGTITWVNESAPGLAGTVLATNLSEPDTSHALSTGETVFIDARLVDHRTTPPFARWYFSVGGAPTGIANVEVLHAHGKYTAQLRTPFTDGTDVTLTDNIEDTAAYNDGSVAIILVNLAERELGSEVLAVGEDYPCWYLQTNSDGTPVYVTYAHDRGLIEVDLAESGTGGVVGTSSSPSSWTYDVTALNGQQILSNVSPEIPRPNGTLAKATRGLAYYRIRLSGSAALPVWRPVLLYAFEIPGTAPCVSP